MSAACECGIVHISHHPMGKCPNTGSETVEGRLRVYKLCEDCKTVYAEMFNFRGFSTFFALKDPGAK